MSVIVWDGKTLAADRRATNSNLSRTTSKITKHGDLLIGSTGTYSSSQAITNWVIEGCILEKFPSSWVHEDTNVWVINRNGTVAKFEDSPFPVMYRDKVFAEGSGRDLAYGALAMGADAVKAVEVACVYDIYCGGGIDTLSFDE